MAFPSAALLPFGPGDARFDQVLLDNFISKAVDWVVVDDRRNLISEHGNGSWESALYLGFLLKMEPALTKAGQVPWLPGILPGLCKSVSMQILARGRKVSADQFTWEGVTWDTAVVARALVQVLARFPDQFKGGDDLKIREAVVHAIHWLFHEFENWQKEEKYAFGSSDLAQILSTLIEIRKADPPLYAMAVSGYQFVSGKETIEDRIATDLLHRRVKEKVGESECVHWDDFFQTAETIDSLSSYLNARGKSSGDLSVLATEIKDAVRKTYLYFEHGQDERGTWGTLQDTPRVLYAYVRTSELLHEVSPDYQLVPEPHRVFKALRWICDSKQRFNDGSFQHSSFLTVFMCDALAEVYLHWDPLKQEVLAAYDEVFWFSPARTTPERTYRMAAEMKLEATEKKLDAEGKELETARKVRDSLLFGLVFVLVALVVNVGVDAVVVGVQNAALLSIVLVGVVTMFTTLLILRWMR